MKPPLGAVAWEDLLLIEYLTLPQQIHHHRDIMRNQHQLSIGTDFPFMHCSGSPSAQRGLPKEGEPTPFERLVNNGSLEAFRVARPEAVGLETY